MPRFTLSVIDRYLFRQMAGPLVATLAVTLLVLLIERALRLLDTILAVHGSIRLLVEMLVYLVPHYLGMALPLGLFLAVLLAFSRLHRDREMDALQAAGISLYRLARPVLLTALVGVLLAGAVFSHLQPFGRYAYRAAVFLGKNASAHAMLTEGVFTDIEGATVLIERISPDHRQFAKVFVYKDSASGESRAIAAPYARLEDDAPSRPPVVSFFEGTEMRVPTGREHTTAPGEAIRFERFTTTVGESGTEVFRPRGGDERELTLAELWRHRRAPPAGVEADDLTAELHGRLVRIATVAVLPFFAVPFALGGRRRAHSARIAVGVLALVLYNELVQVGESLVASGDARPIIALWLPWAVVAVASAGAIPHLARGPGARLIAWRPVAGLPGRVVAGNAER